MYSIHGYGLMVADGRADGYAEALRRSVRPGSIVVDLGAGTGIWAVYACALGAGRVYAIEPADVIGLAMDAAKANGFADRITFVHTDSARAVIADAADVVVADLRDVLPFSGPSLASMIDARRFLAPGGVLIPRRDTVWVAAVSAPAAYHDRIAPWNQRCFGLDFSAARRAALHTLRKERFEPGDLATPPAVWAELDYATLADPSVAGTVRLPVRDSRVAHGLAVWFESDLIDGIRLSNRPGDPPLLYGQAFLPWPEPVGLQAGDSLEVRLRAAPAGPDYLINWTTAVMPETGSADQPAKAPWRVRFSQSTFDGLPLARTTLLQRAADAVIGPGPDRGVERAALDAFDGIRSQGEIADALRSQFPGRFAGRADALTFVSDLAGRIGAGPPEGGRHD
jgi:protein arginine N-methyltransferase 1